MVMLALRMLRRRLGSAAATLIALSLGVVLLSTMGAMVESALRYQPQPGEYGGADLLVARQTLTLPGEDAITADLPEGGTVPIELAEKIRQLPGVADVKTAESAEKPGQATLISVFTDADTNVTHLGSELDAIAATADAGAFTPSELPVGGDENAEAKDLLNQIGASLAGYLAILVAFVVSGTIGLSVRHRRRDLALLRAIAATPGQVRTMIVAEAALIGLVAAAIGVPGGFLATDWVHSQFVDRGFLPAGFPMASGVVSSLIAVVATVLVAMVSALFAARHITGIRPSEALSESAVEPAKSGKVRALFGLLGLVGAGAASIFAVSGDPDAALGSAMGMLFMFIIAVALLAPWINRAGARVLAPALRAVWGDSGYLATRNLRANAQGMTTVLTALVLAVGFGGSVWFLQGNLQRQAVEQTREGTLAQLAVLSPAGLPASATTDVRQLPGVEAVTAVRHTAVIMKSLDGQSVAAQAVDGTDATIDPQVIEGRLADLGTDGVALSAMQASSEGLKVGDTAEFWLGDGTPVKMSVTAIYQRSLGFGDVILPLSAVEGHTAVNLNDQLLVRTAPGADVSTQLAKQFPEALVTSSQDLNRQLEEDLAISSWMNKLVIGVMVGYAALAAANTMVMAALARRRELSLLRLVGVTTRQVKRMVHAEQTALLGVALLIGGSIAAVTLVAIVNALTGDPVPYVPVLGWVTVLGGATVLALTTTVLPINRLLRIPPVESIGIKE